MGPIQDVSANDSLQGMKVQRIDKPTPMNTDPTPDRLATMRMRLREIKQSMDSIDLPSVVPAQPDKPPVVRQNTFSVDMPSVEPCKPKVPPRTRHNTFSADSPSMELSQPAVAPVVRQNTFTIKGSVDLPNLKPNQTEVLPAVRQRNFSYQDSVDMQLEASRNSFKKCTSLQKAKKLVRTSTCPRVYVKRLDYYKPRAASATRVADTNRVHTKANFTVSKDAIKKSLLESLDTSTIANRSNELMENAISKRTSLKASRIPVKIASSRPNSWKVGFSDLEARISKLQLPEKPTSTKIPVSPKFRASLMGQQSSE